MKARQILTMAFGAALLLSGIAIIRYSALPRHNVKMNMRGCRAPATVIDPPVDRSVIGAVVVLPGLGANRRAMNPIATALAAEGLRAFVLDLPGHGDRSTPIRLSSSGIRWGGAIAIRLADALPVAATIAISRTHTRSPIAVAVFGAILASWFIAAIFPLT